MVKIRNIFISILIYVLTGFIDTSYSQTPDRNLVIETVIEAPVTEVWNAFTTSKGLESFFAPECRIDLRIDGKLDILFSPNAPSGLKGVENMRIIAIQKFKLLGFTWINPPELPEISNQRTHVTLKFYKTGTGNNYTRLLLIQDGWGDGELWDQAYQYFARAWKEVILFRLHYRFTKGPVNWDRPPVNKDRFNIIIH